MQRVRAGADLGRGAGDLVQRAYLAEPASRRGCGVLVVHEAQGLGEFARDVCDRLAREGFVALAPDWLGSATPSETPDPLRAAAALDAAVDALLGRDACDGPRIGVLGFGHGGALALELAARSQRAGAVVTCWGAPLSADLAKLDAACLALVAEHDAEAPAAARALEARLRAAGRRAVVHVVPGVAAGFLDSGRHTAYDATAAARAWDEIAGFLRAELA